MKTVTIILSALLSTNIFANISNLPNYEQAMKLAAAAWKPPPRSIDITYYVALIDNTKTEQELRKILEKDFEQMYGPKEDLNPYMLKSREEDIQINLERLLTEQKGEGRKSKLRIRFDGNRQRVDKTYGRPATTIFKGTNHEESQPGKRLDTNTPFETSSIEVTDQNNVSERFEYHYDSKTATRRLIKSRAKFENSRIMKLTMIPNALVLRLKLGSKNNGAPAHSYNYDIDETKIKQLCSGTLDGISVEVWDDEESPDVKDRIEIKLYSNNNALFYESTMICDKKDYSKVYYSDARMPSSNSLISKTTASDFDSSGFPHNVTLVEYKPDGKVKYHETYRIEHVNLNVTIPDEVFEFNPPKGSIVYDFRLTQDERKTQEIASMKEWLGHEELEDKIKSLLRLETLLKDNPEELKNIAASMLDDEQRDIRAKALLMLGQLLKDNPSQLQQITDLLRDDEDPIVRGIIRKIQQRIDSDKQ